MVDAHICSKCGAQIFSENVLCPNCLLGDSQDTSTESNFNAPVASASPPSGVTVRSFGDYDLLEEIARGGMGVVFRARQRSLSRTVALKMIRSGEFASQDLKQRFRTEAEAAASIEHPSIVPIFEIGENGGHLYFTMRFIESGSLQQRMAEFALPQPITQPDRVQLRERQKVIARLIAIVARAVHYAHQHGILHRDLKPGNILLDCRGQPYVTDFGLAKVLAKDICLTQSTHLLGTPAYMAPELAFGGAKKLTTACDIYGLGVILYELLTGRLPFQGATIAETIRQGIKAVPPSPRAVNRAVDPDMETICLTCLEKTPANRYLSAEALAEDLDLWTAGKPIRKRPVRPAEKLWRWCRSEPALASLAFGLLVLLFVVIIGSPLAVWRIDRERRRALRAEQNLTETLRDSYLNGARANRFSSRPGRRFDSLDALGKAAAIRPSADLRNEMIACLALPDVRLLRTIPRGFEQQRSAIFDETLERYAVDTKDNGISIRRVRDDFELVRLEGEGIGSEAVRFSHNGRLLVLRQNDGFTTRVWDIERRRVLLTAKAVGVASAACIGFSPDDKAIAMVEGNREIAIYDLANPGQMRKLPVRFAPHLVQFDPSGQRLAVASGENDNVLVLDVGSGKELVVLPHDNHVWYAAWEPSGAQLGSYTANSLSVYLWNVVTSTRLSRLAHLSQVNGVTFNPAGDLVATASWDATYFWHAATGQLLFRWPGEAEYVQFSADGRLFGQRSHRSGALQLAEFASGQEARVLGTKQEDHTRKPVAFSPNGALLAWAVNKGITIFETSSCRELAVIPHWTHALFFDRNSNLWVGGEAGLARWPLQRQGTSGPYVLGPPEFLVRDYVVHQAVLSADETLLAASQDDHVHIFDTGTLQEIGKTGKLKGNCHFLSISADGRWLAAAPWGDNAILWDVRAGQEVRKLTNTYDVAFSPDGRWLAAWAGPYEGYAFWDLADWTLRPSVPGGDSFGMTFSSDSRLFAVRVKNSVDLIAPETGASLATLEAPWQEPVGEMRFSADGSHLAVASVASRQLILWDLRAIRQYLAKQALDWDQPPFSPPPPQTEVQLIVRDRTPTLRRSYHPTRFRSWSRRPLSWTSWITLRITGCVAGSRVLIRSRSN